MHVMGSRLGYLLLKFVLQGSPPRGIHYTYKDLLQTGILGFMNPITMQPRANRQALSSYNPEFLHHVYPSRVVWFCSFSSDAQLTLR